MRGVGDCREMVGWGWKGGMSRLIRLVLAVAVAILERRRRRKLVGYCAFGLPQAWIFEVVERASPLTTFRDSYLITTNSQSQWCSTEVALNRNNVSKCVCRVAMSSQCVRLNRSRSRALILPSRGDFHI